MPRATFPISEQFHGQITSNSQRMTRTKMIVSMPHLWGRSVNTTRRGNGEVRRKLMPDPHFSPRSPLCFVLRKPNLEPANALGLSKYAVDSQQ